MKYSLCELFSMLDGPGDVCMSRTPPPGELFSEFAVPFAGVSHNAKIIDRTDTDIITGLYSKKGVNFTCLPNSARRLYELSENSFDVFVHVWMSELSLETEMLYFGRKILAAADHSAAERAASNRADDDTRLVLDTAYKVWHEIDRMRGLLRFSPDAQGRYIARCEPDFYILPALGEHFSLRFGDTPWVIIDDKRGLCLRCNSSGMPELYAGGLQPALNSDGAAEPDNWENLWQNYHRTVNNESRNNPGLQRQLMPARYWKNLPEMKPGCLNDV